MTRSSWASFSLVLSSYSSAWSRRSSGGACPGRPMKTYLPALPFSEVSVGLVWVSPRICWLSAWCRGESPGVLDPKSSLLTQDAWPHSGAIKPETQSMGHRVHIFSGKLHKLAENGSLMHFLPPMVDIHRKLGEEGRQRNFTIWGQAILWTLSKSTDERQTLSCLCRRLPRSFEDAEKEKHEEPRERERERESLASLRGGKEM